MLFLALVARFPVFLEFTEMPKCYYTRFLFSAPLLLLSLSGVLSGERRGVISLVCLLAHFACLFRLQIVACSEIF